MTPSESATLTHPITVWLIEDDAFYRRALTDLITDAPDIAVTRDFGSCEAALEALKQVYAPEVIILDIGLPGMLGTEGARRIKMISPASQIIMLTIHEDQEKIFEALCAGASGYLLKNASAERIVEAIREVHQGGVPFTAPIARKVLRVFKEVAPSKDQYGLTRREKEILNLLADGYSQRRMADALSLSTHTIETHLRNIYTKLHVRTGIEAVSKAFRERLIG